MEKNIRFKKFRELDLFIQNSLDKYYFVDPWKKLYDRTGKLHRYIISDKSTIPDLIIYNKTFNKSECYFESNDKSFIKFPRMRFILRPKYKREYNPSVTYGKDNEVYFYIKKESSENKNNKYIQEKNSDEVEKEESLFNTGFDSKLIDEPKNKKNMLKKLEEDDDEEEPEWANDNVEDFGNSKIEFKAIPKTLEDKMIEEIGIEKEKKINENLDKNEKNINIDDFFKDNNNINFIEDEKSKNNINNNENNNNDIIYEELKDFMKNENNEKNKIKEETNIEIFDNNNENKNNFNEQSENISEHFNIFDIENKFNDIFIGDKNSNNTNNSNENNINKQNDNNFNNNINNRNKSRFFNINNKEDIEEIQKKNLVFKQQQQKVNQQYYQMLQKQKLNNQLFGKQNNPNLIQQQLSPPSPYMISNINIPPFSSNQIPFNNIMINKANLDNVNYINNINNQGNNNNFLNSNVNYFRFNNNIHGINNNIPNMSITNINELNNMSKQNLISS